MTPSERLQWMHRMFSPWLVFAFNYVGDGRVRVVVGQRLV